MTGHSPFFLVFGREPLVPLDLSYQHPVEDIAYEDPTIDDYRCYADSLTSALQKAYGTVHRLQVRASLVQAARRDENRQEGIRFQEGDSVLIYEPNAASSTDSASREIHENIQDVPTKWRFKYSGPHIISSVNEARNTCEIWHSKRKQVVTYNIDSIIRYDPYSDTIDDTTHPAKAKESSPADEPLPLVPQQLCAVYLPQDPDQVTVVRYLGKNEVNHLLFQ